MRSETGGLADKHGPVFLKKNNTR